MVGISAIWKAIANNFPGLMLCASVDDEQVGLDIIPVWPRLTYYSIDRICPLGDQESGEDDLAKTESEFRTTGQS